MTRHALEINVYEAAVQRMLALYQEGHRIVVSFSGGKDSGCILGVCLEAAALADRLPIDVVMRDEEAMFPGTFEYCERVYNRDDVSMVWLSARQPIINAFNRREPYWWVFDPDVPRDEWVRQPPEWITWIEEQNIESMVTPERYPVPDGKYLYAVTGLRVSESRGRMYGIHASGGYTTKPNRLGVRYARPIYDWSDGDVWKAHQDYGWDYNTAYDVMVRNGLPRARLRIAPPTMNVAGLDQLAMAQAAWPQWFDRLCRRCPGTRVAAQYGRRAVQPNHKQGETWQETFHRECIETAPEWIRERAVKVRDEIVRQHAGHSTTPLPEVEACQAHVPYLGSWRGLTLAMYLGDPFSMRAWMLPYVEPEYFRPGKGRWGKGSPGW